MEENIRRAGDFREGVNRDLKLFALNSSRTFGEEVSRHLGIGLSPHEEREFADGEHKARPMTNVRGRDVFVIQSLHADQQQSGNDKLCRLLFFVGALKDAAAARVTAVVPYLAYARKDRKTKARDPVTTRYLAALFEAVGADAVITQDVHNLAAYQNAFRCQTEHLDMSQQFSRYFAAVLEDQEVVVVSPDAGGIKRAEQFRQRLARMLGKPVSAAFAEKHRSGDVVSGELLTGDVSGKCAIIVDDLISTGTTMIRAANACHAQGAARILAAASHGLFTGEANTVLADPVLQKIVISDSVPPFRVTAPALSGKVMILSSTGLFAEAIRRAHVGESISELIDA